MKPEIHIGNEIKKELNTQKRSINWLAGEIGCDQSNLCKILNKQHINTELLYRISECLDIDFFTLYSNLLQDKNSKVK